MIEETISKIEAQIRAAETLSPAERQELDDLLVRLRAEARNLDIPDAAPGLAESDDARSALTKLRENLSGFETTHQQTIGLINRISTILANMGI